MQRRRGTWLVRQENHKDLVAGHPRERHVTLKDLAAICVPGRQDNSDRAAEKCLPSER
ncbi:hypothetical protein ABIC42_005676 [Variovorax sp. 1133]